MTLSTGGIPEDLICSIIDELHDDSQTLKRCSTVSRVFVTPCRRHLFRVVSLSVGSYPGPRRYLRLYDLLKSNPTVASHIREVHLDVDYWMIFCDDNTVAQVLRMLSSVRTFLLETTKPFPRWDSGLIPLTSAILDLICSPPVHSLTLWCSCWCTLPFNEMQLGKHIRHLTFSGDQWNTSCKHFEGSSNEDPPRPQFPSLALECLEMGGLGCKLLVGGLLKQPSSCALAQLRELRILGWRDDSFEAARDVFNVAAESLESVIFTGPYFASRIPPEDHPLGVMDLHILRRTRSVVFHVNHIWSEELNGLEWWAWVAPILTTRALPQCLEELTIILETEFDQDWLMGPTAEQVVDDFRWMDFDKVVSHSFTGGNYTNLHKVHLEFLIYEPMDADEDFARRRLFSNCPWLAERGLLSFGVSRSWGERLVLERFSVAKEI